MEKIIIFIIIMIISSVISKNKKKKAAERYISSRHVRSEPENGYKEKPGPVKDLRSMLDALKAAGNSIPPEPAPQKFGYENADASGTVTEEMKYRETSYSQDTGETYDSHAGEVTYGEYLSEQISSEEPAAAEERSGFEHYGGKEKGTKKTVLNLFGTKEKIRNAIIATEVLNRKYI